MRILFFVYLITIFKYEACSDKRMNSDSSELIVLNASSEAILGGPAGSGRAQFYTFIIQNHVKAEIIFDSLFTPGKDLKLLSDAIHFSNDSIFIRTLVREHNPNIQPDNGYQDSTLIRPAKKYPMQTVITYYISDKKHELFIPVIQQLQGPKTP